RPVAWGRKRHPRISLQVRSDVPGDLGSADFFGKRDRRGKLLAKLESRHCASKRHDVGIQIVVLRGDRYLEPFLALGPIKFPLIEGERSHRFCRLTMIDLTGGAN